MYISSRAALIRNASVSIVNGSITLIILLIAPLGIMAVITNTALVTIATYIVAYAADRVVGFLQGDRTSGFFSQPRPSQVSIRDRSHLNKRR